MSDRSDLTLRRRLEGLAAFLPQFDDPSFEFGSWVQPPPSATGVITMPYVDYSATALSFIHAAGRLGWVTPRVAWTSWAKTPEATALFSHPEAVAQADVPTLTCLLTTCIRSDRFSEGALLSHFESGLLTSIVRRAAMLLAEMDRDGSAKRPI